MFETFRYFARELPVFLAGKGALTLAVFAATGIGVATGIGGILPAIAVCVGGTVLTATRRFYRQRLYEDDMMNLYRDNIAQQLGITPAEVTRASLKEAAKDNDILEQALRRQQQRTYLVIGTSVLAGVVSLGLILGFGLDETLKGLAQKAATDILKPLAQFVGMGTVAGLTGLVLRDGLASAIGYGTGIGKAAAHDLILQISEEVARGKPISREDIFAVVVAGDSGLQKRIEQHYRKSYIEMSHSERSRVLHEFHLAEKLDRLALSINRRELRPGYLVYAAHDPRLTMPAIKALDDTPPVPAPTTSFAERLGLAPKQHMSYREQVDASRRSGSLATEPTL